MTRFKIRALVPQDSRTGFDCGNQRINSYFRQSVSQDVRRNLAKCYIASELTNGRLAGFYTLSAYAIPLNDISDALKQKLPKYQSVPIVLIGWLARDINFKGSGLGEAMLFDGLRKIAAAPVGIHMVLVDAIDEKAASFYQDFGFAALTAPQGRMFLPMETIRKAPGILPSETG